jgi:excisionase family DNA binding protein
MIARTQQNSPFKLLVTVEEAAQSLSIGRTQVYELVQKRKIQSVKIGRLRRIPVEALRTFIDQQTSNQPEGRE